ncbi:acyl-CoA dehydrogenase family protein [Frankia sp. Cppng1_Ct_nod]|uniref:acyl-CoA dehydrogenase family protein n=1 Tax=Frankia sp. Cppng1_Ct_nod TaxID=2897162 RepID=UPI0010413FE6|nr:acyl-CoA dehydrogenase family protein [Frankia sp. Cppng1_Ct_nod]
MSDGCTYSLFPGGGRPSDETAEWTARVEKIAPLLVQYRDQAEQDRATPPAVIDALREQNIHRMWISRAFGGGQVGVQTGSAVLQALARVDASVAWQMGVQGAIGRMSDYLPEPVAHRLFRESTGLVVGGINPTGQAEPVPGGYRLRGRWSFASGSAHADWLVCAATLQEDDMSHMPLTGPRIRMIFVPKSAARFVDDWFTVGLRGTGSTTYCVDGLVVPEEHTVDGSLLRRPPAHRPSRAYGIAYYDFAPFTTASTALGIAQDALVAFRSLAREKIPARATSPLAASHTVQAGLARAEILMRAGALLLTDAADHATAHGEHGGENLSALIRLAATAVGENTAAAVDTLYDLAGTSSLYTASRLDRCFRDIHTAVKHITLSQTNFEMVGQYLLGGALLIRR